MYSAFLQGQQAVLLRYSNTVKLVSSSESFWSLELSPPVADRVLPGAGLGCFRSLLPTGSLVWWLAQAWNAVSRLHAITHGESLSA